MLALVLVLVRELLELINLLEVSLEELLNLSLLAIHLLDLLVL
jgi:hypothetical protein